MDFFRLTGEEGSYQPPWQVTLFVPRENMLSGEKWQIPFVGVGRCWAFHTCYLASLGLNVLFYWSVGKARAVQLRCRAAGARSTTRHRTSSGARCPAWASARACPSTTTPSWPFGFTTTPSWTNGSGMLIVALWHCLNWQLAIWHFYTAVKLIEDGPLEFRWLRN